MSRFPGGRSDDGSARPLRQAAGRPRRQSLLRHDIEDDPGQGSLLYKAIVDQDTTELTADGWADRLEAIERTKARLAAWEAEAVAGFDDALHGVSADLGHRHPEPGDRPATPGERRWIAGDLRSVADEIALILNLSKGQATKRIHTSCELVHNFPATLHALREGWITERAAFTIVRELSILEDIADIRAAEAAVLAWANTHPLTDIKQACQREAARRCPAASDKRHRRAHDERSVRMVADGDGRAYLVHDHDAVDTAAVMTSLSRSAADRRRKGDPRTMDQLRNDIALNRLLPRTKRNRTTTPSPGSTTHKASEHTSTSTASSSGHNTNAPHDISGTTATDPRSYSNFEPVDDSAHESVGHRGHEPAGDYDHEPGSDHECEPAGGHGYEPARDHDYQSSSDHGYRSPGDREYEAAGNDGADTADGAGDGDVVDEGAIGAEATVVIHASGAEVLALINGEVGTGGEADHHGPIPQSSLRKHLLKALSQRLQPNLPTIPSSSRLGAAIRRARTTETEPSASQQGRTTGARARMMDADSQLMPEATSSALADALSVGGTSIGGSGIEFRITDRPPPSDPDRYTPSAALERYVRLRDRTCQFPGCKRPAEFTDVDHRIPFASGGRTTAANLWCLCRHHHRLKHEGGWEIEANSDGSFTWISPTGRRYRNNPAYRPPPPE